MSRFSRALTGTALLALASLGACAERPAEPLGDQPRAAAARATLAAGVDTLLQASERLIAAVDRLPADTAAATEAQAAFAEARFAFKRVEALLEFYQPVTAKHLNGTPLPEVNLDEGPHIVEPAEGFPRLEELLFPAVAVQELDELRSELTVLRDHIARIPTTLGGYIARDEHPFDAARTEVARIVTLGITGFDSPVRVASMEEARHALRSISAALAPYRADLTRDHAAITARFDALLVEGDARLAGADFDGFDRLGFIVAVANPLADAIAEARDALGIATPTEPRFWRASARTLFERNAFDADFLRPVNAPASTPERVALGARLFFDPALSGDGSRACASCHLPERAFSDGLPVSAALPGDTTRLRNAPTVINAALQGAQFADLRAVFLEDQVTDVVTNRAEMHGVLSAAAARLAQDPTYAEAFSAAYAGQVDSGLTPRTIRSAIASYLRSLVRLDSRVDLALRGDTAALTPEERLGLNVFAGKGACATCHFLPLTNGTVPPMFERTEQEVIGVPATPVWRGARVDSDEGRARITQAALHRFAFKTPSVRNAAVTAPYMHNGVYRSLEEVIKLYDVGGGAGMGIDLPNQTLPPDPLGLSDAEQRALVRFLEALTDTARTTARPVLRAALR